jgi:hypothetical protein
MALEPTPQSGRRPLIPILLLLLTAAQIGLTVTAFKSRADLTNDQPLLNVDFCSQYYWSHAARAFHARDGRLWGYDPFFMAGYPLDFVVNSSLPIQLAAVAFDGLNLARVIKACFVVSFVLVPFVFFFALRQFGLSPPAALATAGLGLVYFWVSENALFGLWGMIAGAFLLNYYLFPLALLDRWLHERRRLTLVLFVLAFAAAFIVHKTAFVLVPPLTLIWLAFYRRERKTQETLWLALFIGVGVNMFWLGPFFHFLPLKVEDPATTFFQNTDPLRLLKDLWPLPPHPHYGLPMVRLMLLGFGVAGLVTARRDDPRRFGAMLAGIVLFGLFTYFGSLIPPLRHLQPYRFVTAWYYLWLIPAGRGLRAAYGIVSERRGAWAARGLGAALAAGLLAILGLAPSYRGFSRLSPLTTALDGPSREMIAWLQAHTDRSARVLFEDVNVWSEGGPVVYGGAKLASLVPALAPRELIGGPLPNAFIVHHYAAFEDGRLCGEPIERLSDEELRARLRLYNVGWAVCWSEAAKARLARLPGATREAAFGYLEIFSLEGAHSFFLEGGGRVEANYNRLRLSGLTTESGRVVISYHWVEGLKSRPEAKLTRVMVGPDPVGFIGIESPPGEVELRLGPLSPWQGD